MTVKTLASTDRSPGTNIFSEEKQLAHPVSQRSECSDASDDEVPVLPDYTYALHKDLAKDNVKDLDLNFHFTDGFVNKIDKHLSELFYVDNFTAILCNLFMLDFGMQSYQKDPCRYGDTMGVFPLREFKAFLENCNKFQQMVSRCGGIKEYLEKNQRHGKLLKEISELLKKAGHSDHEDIIPHSLLMKDGSRIRDMSTIAKALDSIAWIFKGSLGLPDEEEEQGGYIDMREEYEVSFELNSEAVEDFQKVWSHCESSGGTDKLFKIVKPWCDLFFGITTEEKLAENLQHFFTDNYKIEEPASGETSVSNEDWFQRGRMFNHYIASVLTSREFWYASFEQQEMALHNTLLYVTKHPECFSKEYLVDNKYVIIQRYILQELLKVSSDASGRGVKRRHEDSCKNQLIFKA